MPARTIHDIRDIVRQEQTIPDERVRRGPNLPQVVVAVAVAFLD
jgi:hypothetical protein